MVKTVTVTVTVDVDAATVPCITSMCDIDNIVWTHHSVGANISITGGLVAKLQALGYTDLWEHTLTISPITHNGANTADFPRVPDDNTDIDNWPTMYGQTVHDPPDNWLSDMCEHQVIMLKSCHTMLPITSDEQLAGYETDTTSVWGPADDFPEKLFVVMTVPPLVEATAGGAVAAARARSLANWMVANLETGRDNVRVYDLFDLMADVDNYMKDDWSAGPGNSHPDDEASAIIAQDLANWLDLTIKNWRAV